MDALRALARGRIEVSDVEQRIYKRFTYRLVIDFRGKHGGKKNHLLLSSNEDTALTSVLDTCTGRCKTQRCGAFHRYLYFEKLDDAVMVATAYKDCLWSVASPRNEAAQKALLDDPRVRIRDVLFWGRYRWSVVLKPRLEKGVYERIEEWLRDTFGEEKRRGERAFLCWGNPSRVHFAHEDDVLLMKLGFHDAFQSVEKAITKKELGYE